MPAKKQIKRSRYNQKELKEFKVLIEEKLDRAKEQMQYYLTSLAESADNADSKIKALDDGVSTVENERLITMASRQKKLIQHLENARLRIQNQTYGICRETGNLISKERLRAVPHATLSIKAKQGRKG